MNADRNHESYINADKFFYVPDMSADKNDDSNRSHRTFGVWLLITYSLL